jgi:hypothetical protein
MRADHVFVRAPPASVKKALVEVERSSRLLGERGIADEQPRTLLVRLNASSCS